jgi:hypothetical protein
VITLDLADLVVIAGRTLDLGTDAVLERLDVAAAEAALAEGRRAVAPADQGRLVGTFGTVGAVSLAESADPAAHAASAAVALMRGLLVHRPFAQDGLRVAAAAGLQFLAVNGWRARLEPPETAAVVIEALASGRLSRDGAARWLAPHLSALPSPTAEAAPAVDASPAAETSPATVPAPARARAAAGRRRPVRPAGAGIGRRLISALIAMGLGSLALLAAACAGPATPSAPGTGPRVTAHHVSTPR